MQYENISQAYDRDNKPPEANLFNDFPNIYRSKIVTTASNDDS